MSLFRFKPACPATLTVRTPLGVVIEEVTCVLERKHFGQHVGKRGQSWWNLQRLEDDIEKRFDDARKRPK